MHSLDVNIMVCIRAHVKNRSGNGSNCCIHVLCPFLFLQEFMEQFRVLLPKNATACKEDISALLEKKMGLDPTTYQIGKTKVQPVILL